MLLSYPDPDRPNRVELYDRRDKLVFTTKLEEPDLGPQRNRSDDVVPPFNAYSASGNPKVRSSHSQHRFTTNIYMLDMTF